MTKLSLRAAKQTENICKAIINHPFNQEMMRGTLSRERFGYYIEQDYLYLKELRPCYTALAGKATEKYKGDFLKHADYTLIYEQEMLKLLEGTFGFNKTGFIAPATLDYIKHLSHNCTNELLEVGMASTLACCTVYQQIGIFFRDNYSADNPYNSWNETYSTKDYTDSVDRAVEIFDELADNTNEATRQKMLDVHSASCWFEWRFFNDSYHQIRLDNLKNLRDLPLAPSQRVQKPDVTKILSQAFK